MSRDKQGIDIEVEDGRVTISFDQGDARTVNGWSNFETQLLKLYVEAFANDDFTASQLLTYPILEDINKRLGDDKDAEFFDKLSFYAYDGVGSRDELREMLKNGDAKMGGLQLEL